MALSNKQRSAIAGMVLSASVLVGIAVKEAYRGDAYIPVPGDVPTLGFGATDGVKLGQKTTPERALVRLLGEANKYSDGVKSCVTAPLYPHEFDAYVSLAYNIGIAGFCGSSIPGKLSDGQYAAACQTILGYDKFRDRSEPKIKNPRTGKMEYPLVPLRGLTIRRQEEYRQCVGGIDKAIA